MSVHYHSITRQFDDMGMCITYADMVCQYDILSFSYGITGRKGENPFLAATSTLCNGHYFLRGK